MAKALPEVRLSPQKLNSKADRLIDGFRPYSTIVNNTSGVPCDSQTWLAVNGHLNGKVCALNGGLSIAIFIHLEQYEQSKQAHALRPSIHAVKKKPLAFVGGYIVAMLIVTIATSL